MSNYVKTVDFAAKDALSSGNPSKLVKGVEINTEFVNIATSIATKEDTANKNQASGYAGLDSSSRLAKANQHSSTAYTDAAANFTAGLQSSGVNVVTTSGLLTTITGIDGAGSGIDADLLDGQQGAYYLPAANYTAADALAKLLTVDGTGTGLDADLLDGQHGSYYQSASNLNSGTIPDARIASTGVTQHQTSITAVGASATIGGVLIGYRDVPRRTSGFARGEASALVAGVTLETSDMAAGYCFTVYNDSGSSITITAGSGVTLRLAGTASTGNRALASRGLMTIWCNSGSEAIASGPGVS